MASASSSPRRSFDSRFRVAVGAKKPLYARAAAVVSGGIGLLLFCLSYKVKTSGSNSVRADFGPPVTFRKCVNPDHIALTFDDGPSVWTLALLDIFERYNVQATFFFVGVNLEHDPTNRRAAQLVVEKGHQVASHTWSHKHMTDLTPAENREELRKTADIIASVTGYRPRYMRQPYGDTNNAVETVLAAEDYKSMLWSCDSNDWRYTKEADVTPNLNSCDLNGLVLLLHEGRASTAEAVEKFLRRVRATHPEKKFVRADECSGYLGDAYIIDAGASVGVHGLKSSG